ALPGSNHAEKHHLFLSPTFALGSPSRPSRFIPRVEGAGLPQFMVPQRQEATIEGQAQKRERFQGPGTTGNEIVKEARDAGDEVSPSKHPAIIRVALLHFVEVMPHHPIIAAVATHYALTPTTHDA
ncbi:MAG TPA: hypothetical protein VIO16_07405, partial [Dehalococcoidia bacterium]